MSTPKQISDIEKEALQLVNSEVKTWEDATVFVTDRVAFQMRNLIKQLRKNYYGIFDVPIDPTTGRKKIWVPMTESMVETVVKTIDLDTKDINFRAKKSTSQGLTTIVRAVTKYVLDCIGFGEKLDQLERSMAIDGTAVWKILKGEHQGKTVPDLKFVDLLNIYIDPSSNSIQEAYRFTERSLLTKDEVLKQDWINTNDLESTTGLAPNDARYNTNETSTTALIDVYESWGKYPLYLITGKKEDKNKEADIHVIVSGLDSPGKERVHLIEKYDGVKPYEEAWYMRVPGRWYGRGVAEKLLMLQLWLNTIVNIRITRSYLSQQGLFKIRKGAGITPQMLSRLPANGAIVVNDINDIEQMAMQEASQASYKDEDNIVGWGRQVTAAFEVISGEALPSSTSATATALQSQSAQSQFVLIREGLGMFLERLIQNHMLPMLFKYFKKNDIVRIVGDDPELIKSLDERVVYEQLYTQIEMINNSGFMVDPMQVQMEIQRAFGALQNSGKDRYVELLEDLDPGEYDTKVYVTNEEFDKGVMIQNLNQMLATLPALGFGPDTATSIVKQIIDLMGLDSTLVKAPMPMMQPGMNENNTMQSVNPMTQPGGNPMNISGVPPQGLNELAAASNTLEPNGR